jgi:hypothetical protein
MVNEKENLMGSNFWMLMIAGAAEYPIRTQLIHQMSVIFLRLSTCDKWTSRKISSFA